MSPIYSWTYSILAHLRRKHSRNSDVSGLALLTIGPQASVPYANGCPFFTPFSLESAVPRQPQLQTAPSHGGEFYLKTRQIIFKNLIMFKNLR